MGQATCPDGVSVAITPGKTVSFPAERCQSCRLKAQCTTSKQGRSLAIHAQEALLQQLGELPKSSAGRAQLRERVAVEHGLAHISQRQGNRARYNGIRKNTYHLRITAAIQNLETAQRLVPQEMAMAA